MVDTIDVKNAVNATVTVATNDAVKASVDTLVARTVTQLGTRTVAQSPAVNIATDQPAVPVNQRSAAHDVRLDWARPADTTAYLAGDVVGGAKQFAAVGLSAGGILITGVQLAINVASFTSGAPTSFRQHFYSATPPSALADNAPWDLPSGDRATYLGFIDIPAISDLGSTYYVELANINKQIRLATADVWSYLVTNGAYTPSSSEGYSQTLHTVEV